MHYLRNTWYAAALASELSHLPLGRVLLGEKIVFFRDSKGGIAALQNRCPHRFAPLSMGKVKGDEIECGYHGLRFGADGVCKGNPHGNKQVPNASTIKYYPAAERDGFIWFWPGDPAKADPNLIPAFPEMSDTENYTAVFGYLPTMANYELVIDNLLDLSHVEFLHPMFQQPEGVDAHKTEFKQEGNVIHAMRWKPDTAIHGLAGNLYWTSPSKRGDARAHMHWSAPSILHFDLGVTEVGAPEKEGICLPNAHLVTPQDEFNSHYFWSIARNRKVGAEEASQKLFMIVNQIFATEDLPIIEAQQDNMEGSSDLMAMQPVSLEPDIPAVRARRILRQLIEDEQAASASAQAAE